MAMKSAGKQDLSAGMDVSYFDINQLELAFVNRALENPRRKIPTFIEISRKRRILQLQKKNLMDVCRKTGKERRKDRLENELQNILTGKRRLSIGCFLFK